MTSTYQVWFGEGVDETQARTLVDVNRQRRGVGGCYLFLPDWLLGCYDKAAAKQHQKADIAGDYLFIAYLGDSEQGRKMESYLREDLDGIEVPLNELKGK